MNQDPRQVDEEDLRKILTNKQFVRYQQFFLLASLRNDPTVRWCPKYVDSLSPGRALSLMDMLAWQSGM
jgi:hypothetical protein